MKNILWGIRPLLGGPQKKSCTYTISQKEAAPLNPAREIATQHLWRLLGSKLVGGFLGSLGWRRLHGRLPHHRGLLPDRGELHVRRLFAAGRRAFFGCLCFARVPGTSQKRGAWLREMCFRICVGVSVCFVFLLDAFCNT